jgi:hypothetical protein
VGLGGITITITISTITPCVLKWDPLGGPLGPVGSFAKGPKNVFAPNFVIGPKAAFVTEGGGV